MNWITRQAISRAVPFWLCVGVVIGLVGSSAVAGTWLDAGSGTRVQVLGSGTQISVLITHDQRRVLIASGTDGAAFANAIAKALPPLFDSLDIVLIDPNSSADVIERARSLSARQTYILPTDDQPVTAQTIERSFSIQLGIVLRLSVTVRESDWVAVFETAAGSIAIASGEPLTGRGLIAITLDGTGRTDGQGTSSITIGPARSSFDRSGNRATVGPGSVMTISVVDSQFRLDREYFALP